MFTTLYINFSDMQGQITLELVVSGRNLNSSKLSCMSSLPARMRMIESKMKELECPQDFSHYKSMGIFPVAQGQLTPQSLVESGQNSNLSEILWLSLLPASMKKIRSKMKALACSQKTNFMKDPSVCHMQIRSVPCFTCQQDSVRKPHMESSVHLTLY